MGKVFDNIVDGLGSLRLIGAAAIYSGRAGSLDILSAEFGGSSSLRLVRDVSSRALVCTRECQWQRNATQ
jgi:hypothetical protein